MVCCEYLCLLQKKYYLCVTKTYVNCMKRAIFLLVAVSLFVVGCNPGGEDVNTEIPEGVSLTISLEAATRTSIAASDNDGAFPTHWNIGDQVMVNTVLSDKVSNDEHNKSVAKFNFSEGSISAPYSVTYPHCSLTSAEKTYIEFPAVQNYEEYSVAVNSAPMCGYAESGNEVTLKHLSAILHLPVKALGESVKLKEVILTSASGKLSGIFRVDCQTATLSTTNSSKSSLTYALPANFSLLTAEICDMFIAVPAGEVGDLTVEFIETSGGKMTATWSSSEALPMGVVQEFNTVLYEKGASCELELLDKSVPTFKKYASCDEIKIMSFNVRTTLTESNTDNNWDNRKGACVELIKDHMPTIIGVQEAKYQHHWTYLKEQLADDYSGYGVNRDTGKESGTGETMGILYNKSIIQKLDGGTFWLSETPDVPSKGFGASYSRCATWGLFKHKTTGKKICYINTHIDHQVKEAQIEGMKLISKFFEKYKDEYLLFITADFNMRSDNEAFDPIAVYMYNTREIAPEGLTDYDTTFNGFTTGKDSIIDHIYCSDYLEVVEYHTINEQYGGVTYVSDHYPIYSIIKLQ